MYLFLQILTIVAGLLLPGFMVRAVKAKEQEEEQKYIVLASLCLGYIVFFFVGSIGQW